MCVRWDWESVRQGHILPHSPLTRVAVHLELPVYRWPFGATDIGIFLGPELTVIIVLFIAKTGLAYEVSVDPPRRFATRGMGRGEIF